MSQNAAPEVDLYGLYARPPRASETLSHEESDVTETTGQQNIKLKQHQGSM